MLQLWVYSCFKGLDQPNDTFFCYSCLPHPKTAAVGMLMLQGPYTAQWCLPFVLGECSLNTYINFPNPCFCPTCDSKNCFMTFTAKCRTRCDSGGIPFAAIREGSCRKLATILHTSSGRPIPVIFWSSVQNVPGFMHHENTWSGVSCPIPWYYTTVTGGSKHWSVEPELTTRRQIVADNAFHWSCALRLAPLWQQDHPASIPKRWLYLACVCQF